MFLLQCFIKCLVGGGGEGAGDISMNQSVDESVCIDEPVAGLPVLAL